jgi:hypothetical protein
VSAAAWSESSQRGVYVAEGPDGLVMAVTRSGRSTWLPGVFPRDGAGLWRGPACSTRAAAQRLCEAEAANRR